MRFIDTHLHLYDEAFDSDRDEAIMRMRRAGVEKCILPAIDRSSFERQSSLAKAHKGFMWQAIGLHPTSVKENWKAELQFVKDELDRHRADYVAIGEIGLDGYWSKDFMEEQKRVLKEQLLLAKEHSLPVIIHLREATEELFEVLDSPGVAPFRGVFHAFSGSAESYRRLKKYGDIKFGIGGVVTYKNAGVAVSLKSMQFEDLLLETDAPWLTPVPFRGKRNESAYLVNIAQKIAELKDTDAGRVAQVTSENAEKLFGI